MSDVTLTVQPDGKLEIRVTPEYQADLVEWFAQYDAAVTAGDDRAVRLIREPDFGSEVMGAGGTSCPLGNGWDWIRPEEIGALTSDDNPIIAYDVKRDSQGNLIRVFGYGGTVFYDNFYAIRNCVRTLAECGAVLFLPEKLEQPMRQMLVRVELTVNIPDDAIDPDEAMMPIVAGAITQLDGDQQVPGVNEWQIISSYEINPETGEPLDED